MTKWLNQDVLLESIDFNDVNKLIGTFRHNKVERIEGILIERAFAKDILSDSSLSYSSNWWFPDQCVGEAYKLSNPDNLVTDLDIKLFVHFLNRQVRVFLVSFNEAEKSFDCLTISQSDIPEINNRWLKNKKKLTGGWWKEKAPVEEKEDNKRWEKLVRVLIQYNRTKINLIKEIALSRLFAELFRFRYDVDFFIEHKDKLYACDVKQKSPSYGKHFVGYPHFGFNEGLVSLCRKLAELGIESLNVILTKPDKKKSRKLSEDLNIDYILNKGKDNFQCKWLASILSSEIYTKMSYPAPWTTSLSGNYDMFYKAVDITSYSILKDYTEQKEDVLRNYLEGQINPIRDLAEIGY